MVRPSDLLQAGPESADGLVPVRRRVPRRRLLLGRERRARCGWLRLFVLRCHVLRRLAHGSGAIRQLDDFALALARPLALAFLGRLLGPSEAIGMALAMLAGSPAEDSAQAQDNEDRD